MKVRRGLIGAWLIAALSVGPLPSLAAEEPGLGVEEVLLALRQELNKIRAASKTSGILSSLRLKGVSLKLQFVMVRETQPDGKSRLRIVPVEVGHDYQAEAVHTLTLEIEPATGAPVMSRRPGPAQSPRKRPSEPRPAPQGQQPLEPQQQPQPEPQQPGPQESED